MLMAPPRGFPDAEFEARTARAQQCMQHQALDVLLLCSEPEVRYFSGFDSQFWESPTRPWFLLVPAKGKPIAVIPSIGYRGMAATWIDEIHCWDAPQPDDDGVSLLVHVLKRLAVKYARVGLPMGHETQLRMPLQDLLSLQQQLNGVEFVDAVALTRGLRSIKSSAEIEKIRYVCDLMSQSFQALPEFAKTGQSERQICKQLAHHVQCAGADRTPYMIAGSGRGGYHDIIMGPTERILEQEDILIIDTGTVYDGYFCDFDRNYAFTRANNEAQAAYRLVHAALEAGLQAARPGNTASDLFYAMWHVLAASGGALGKVGRLGHGLGMQLTEWPSNMANDHTRLECGMVMTLEPSMTYGDGRLMVQEENIVIRDGEPELLTRRAPAELPIVD